MRGCVDGITRAIAPPVGRPTMPHASLRPFATGSSVSGSIVPVILISGSFVARIVLSSLTRYDD